MYSVKGRLLQGFTGELYRVYSWSSDDDVDLDTVLVAL